MSERSQVKVISQDHTTRLKFQTNVNLAVSHYWQQDLQRTVGFSRGSWAAKLLIGFSSCMVISRLGTRQDPTWRRTHPQPGRVSWRAFCHKSCRLMCFVVISVCNVTALLQCLTLIRQRQLASADVTTQDLRIAEYGNLSTELDTRLWQASCVLQLRHVLNVEDFGSSWNFVVLCSVSGRWSCYYYCW